MNESTCTEDGCERSAHARGVCYAHYRRAWRAGRLDDYARTPVLVGDSYNERLRRIGWDVAANGCWVWRGSRNTSGYGQVAVNNRPIITSRAAYAAWVAPLAAGDVVCHRCDNPPCINPAHLFVGDRATNNQDMAAKRRVAHGERHKWMRLTDDDVRAIRDRFAEGGVTRKELAAQYGVTRQYMERIISNRVRTLPTVWIDGRERGVA